MGDKRRPFQPALLALRARASRRDCSPSTSSLSRMEELLRKTRRVMFLPPASLIIWISVRKHRGWNGPRANRVLSISTYARGVSKLGDRVARGVRLRSRAADRAVQAREARADLSVVVGRRRCAVRLVSCLAVGPARAAAGLGIVLVVHPSSLSGRWPGVRLADVPARRT